MREVGHVGAESPSEELVLVARSDAALRTDLAVRVGAPEPMWKAATWRLTLRERDAAAAAHRAVMDGAKRMLSGVAVVGWGCFVAVVVVFSLGSRLFTCHVDF